MGLQFSIWQLSGGGRWSYSNNLPQASAGLVSNVPISFHMSLTPVFETLVIDNAVEKVNLQGLIEL